jgi:hypothetical protein
MAKFTVTVYNVSSVEVEAVDEEAACRWVDNAIAYGTDGVMGLILKGQTGWEATNVTAHDDKSAGTDPGSVPENFSGRIDEYDPDYYSM